MLSRKDEFNKNRRAKLWWLLLIFYGACTLNLASAHAADIPDKGTIIKQARMAYYNIKRQGFAGFESSAEPNWKMLLKDEFATEPTAAEAAMKKLMRMQFKVSFSSNGVTKVTHENVTPDNAKMAEGFDQVYRGMEQMLSGFFDTWSPFMLYSPFPAVGGDYRLDELSTGYRLSYKENSADVVIIMSKDFAIGSLKVATTNFSSEINPKFTKSPQGYILTDYDATYVGSDHSTDTQLKVHIEYKKVDKLQLPSKIHLSGSYGGSPFDMETNLTNYRLENH